MPHQLHGVLCSDDPDAIQNAVCQVINVCHAATPATLDDLRHSTGHTFAIDVVMVIPICTDLLAENLPSVSKYITLPPFLHKWRAAWLLVVYGAMDSTQHSVEEQLPG